MQQRQIIILGIGLAIIAGSLGVMQLLGKMKEPPEKEKPIVAKKYAKTTPVRYKDVSTEIIAYGRVKAADNMDLIAEKQGKISSGKIKLKEGQKVNKGDLVFKVDDTEARLNLQAQKSNFLRDLASTLPDFKIDFPDSYEKWSQYFESIDLNKTLAKLPDFTSNKEKTYLATKNIFTSYYNIKSMEDGLRKHFVYAPYTGVIANISMQSGSYVTPGSKVAKIHRTDRQEIKVDVEISDISWISKGYQVKVISENTNHYWTGKVSRISELVNEKTQSINVFITLDNNKIKIYDGQYLRAIIPALDIENSMELPREAVFKKNHVFVVKDSILHERQVAVHKVNEESIVINGLPEGTDVVIEPLVNAHNGMKIFKLSDKGSGKEINLETKNTANIDKLDKPDNLN